MGEAQRRHELRDMSAKGTVRFVVNGKPSGAWTGTGAQRDFLNTTKANGFEPYQYAKISASYHMAFGAPHGGDLDRRPSAKPGETWDEAEAAIARGAVLWLAFRIKVDGTEQTFGDLFDGGDWVVAFNGSPEVIGSLFSMRIGQTSLVFPKLSGQNPN
jgi:hypothetical protein